MVSICFNFNLNIFSRINKYKIYDIGKNYNYFDEVRNKEFIDRLAKSSYLPLNKLLLELLEIYKDKFKLSITITGTSLELLEKYAPEVIENLKKISSYKNVEFLSCTYNNSFVHLFSITELKSQITNHCKLIQKFFNQTPTIFNYLNNNFDENLNKFLIDNNFKGALLNNSEPELVWESQNKNYSSSLNYLPISLKNTQLSDDISYRFSNHSWESFPLTATKFSNWLLKFKDNETINISIDYESFGEYNDESSGIFKFLKYLPKELISKKINFVNLKDIFETLKEEKVEKINFTNSSANIFLENQMQQNAAKELFMIEKDVKNLFNKEITQFWRKLTSSDLFYLMSTKNISGGNIHQFFNSYESPYETYVYFMNILNDLIIRVNLEKEKDKIKSQIKNNVRSKEALSEIKEILEI